MELLCHRCGNTLHEGEGFCPHCGVPQLIVDTSEPVGPQQPAQRLGVDPARVEWRVAIGYALLLAVPVGLLSAFAGMSSLFVIAGGFGAIALYRKRTDSFTDGSIGWRVGAILGAAAATIATLADGLRLLVERYFLHHGTQIDGQFASVAQQLADQALKSNSQAMQQAPQLVAQLGQLLALTRWSCRHPAAHRIHGFRRHGPLCRYGRRHRRPHPLRAAPPPAHPLIPNFARAVPR